MMKKMILASYLSLASYQAVAESSLPSPWLSYSGGGSSGLVVAAADVSEARPMMELAPAQNIIPYQANRFTGNTLHKYLGLGSLAAAILTGISPKTYDGPHEYFADTAAVLGLGAVITGFTFHGDEISLGNGAGDPDNLHMLLTSVGTLGYMAAVSEGGEDNHVSYGVAGFLGMAVGVKMVW